MASDEGNWGYAILGLTIAFLVVVLIFLFLRIVTRVWIVHQFWWGTCVIFPYGYGVGVVRYVSEPRGPFESRDMSSDSISYLE